MSTSRLMRELKERRGAGPVRYGGEGEGRGEGRGRGRGRGKGRGKGKGEIMPHPAQSHSDPVMLEQLKGQTPAKVGVGRTGLRFRTQTAMQFQADFAVAQAAVESLVPEGWAEQQGMIPLITRVRDHEQFLLRPDLGRRLDEQSLELVRARCARQPDVQIVVGDGLSANAVMLNALGTLESLTAHLSQRGLTVGTLVFVRFCRAKIVDVVGQATGAKVGIILVGERPGLGTGDGMSAYLVWDPHHDRTDAEKQCISNIHRRGLLPEEAGLHAANIIAAIMAQQTAGVGLDLSGVELPSGERPRANQTNPEAALGCGQSHGQQCNSCRSGLPGSQCGRSDGRPCETSTH